jgi:hypothetical protein
MDSTDSQDLACPFCQERGFDLIGLKSHLLNYCERFDNVEDAQTLIARQLIRTREDAATNSPTP